MPLTYLSVPLVWLLTFGLFVLTESGAVTAWQPCGSGAPANEGSPDGM